MMAPYCEERFPWARLIPTKAFRPNFGRLSPEAAPKDEGAARRRKGRGQGG